MCSSCHKLLNGAMSMARLRIPSQKVFATSLYFLPAEPQTQNLILPRKDGTGGEAVLQLQELCNTHILCERLNTNLVVSALQCCARPCRVLISGPASYNEATRSMLTGLVEVDEQVSSMRKSKYNIIVHNSGTTCKAL